MLAEARFEASDGDYAVLVGQGRSSASCGGQVMTPYFSQAMPLLSPSSPAR